MSVKKKAGLFVSTLAMILVIIIIGPLDIFTHGFFYDEIDCSQIAPEDFQGCINLENGAYEMSFSPQEPHMTGFEIYLAHQPEGNTGNLRMSIFDDSGKKLDDIFVDLSKVPEASWYKVYTSADLKEDREYILRFKAEDCATIPYLQCVDSSYLPDETITGDVLLVYAYAESTFTFQNKVIFALFIVAAWGLGCAEFLNKGKKAIRIVSAGIFMTAVLTWNYMYNSMDTQNSSFSNFQSDSETLVTSVIRAEENGVYFRYENEAGYGLGRYHELKGTWLGYGLDYITDDNWLSGYSRTQGAILVNYANIYNREVAVEGNYLVFENGEKFQITNVEDNGNTIVLYLNTDKILTPENTICAAFSRSVSASARSPASFPSFAR